MANNSFRPALLCVDIQNDFCPPSGSYAVDGARELSTLINEIVSYPAWSIRVATQDWHPTTHVSFASNHPAPNNKPFESIAEVRNPHNLAETMPQKLGPDHCIQGSKGAEIIDEIALQPFDLVVKKGMNPDIEMYSAFADTFGNMDCIKVGGATVDLADHLRQRSITDVFCVGVAGDYCVKESAISAAQAGFRSFVIKEASRCVDAQNGWTTTSVELERANAALISIASDEVQRLKSPS